MIDRITPALVDRALEQTRSQGMIYAVVPLPWLQDWLVWVDDRGGGRFHWWDACIHPSFRSGSWHDEAFRDDEGNVLMCLLEPGHEDDCGPIRAGLAVRQ